jgi:hypothetical protein
LNLVVQSATDPSSVISAVRQAVREIDPDHFTILSVVTAGRAMYFVVSKAFEAPEDSG